MLLYYGQHWERNLRTVYEVIYLVFENKLIICALGNLHYKISREKFEPELGFGPPDF